MPHPQSERSAPWLNRISSISLRARVTSFAVALITFVIGAEIVVNIYLDDGDDIYLDDGDDIYLDDGDDCIFKDSIVHGDVICVTEAAIPDEESSQSDNPKPTETIDEGPIDTAPTSDTRQITTETYPGAPCGSSSIPLVGDDPLLDDDPLLVDLDAEQEGGECSWFEPPRNINETGYGDNGFRFTLAIGESGDDELDNFARWEFEVADKTYDIQPWIPSRWAAAEVEYLIWMDENGDGSFSARENVYSAWLNQAEVSREGSGWVSLGRHFDLRGKVRIEVRDTRSRDDWRTNHDDEIESIVTSRIAVDAIRLVEV